MTIERILGTDTRKAAFEKADRNFVELNDNKANLVDLDYSNGFAYTDFHNTNMLPRRYTIYSSDVLHPPYSGLLSGLIDIKKMASGELFIEFRPWNSIDIYLLNYSNNVWTAWQKIVTDKQTDWITGTLQNGWTGTFKYRKNQLGQLEAKFELIAGTIAAYTYITTLPEGYRADAFFDIAFINVSNTQKGYFYYNKGTASIYVSPAVTLIAGQECAGSFVVPLD